MSGPLGIRGSTKAEKFAEFELVMSEQVPLALAVRLVASLNLIRAEKSGRDFGVYRIGVMRRRAGLSAPKLDYGRFGGDVRVPQLAGRQIRSFDGVRIGTARVSPEKQTNISTR